VPDDALSSLKKVREHAVDRAVRTLGDAVDARRGAGAARIAAEEALGAHGEALAAAAGRERQALERGVLRASDLAEGAAWTARAKADLDGLTARVVEARRTEEGLLAREDRARAELAARKVGADLVATTISRRAAERRKAAEVRAEQAASEAWRPRR
jgi:hypothetical protein